MCVHFAKVEEENRDYTDISSICADYYGWRSVVNKELIVTPVSRRHTEQSGNKIATKRVLNVSPIDIIRSEGDVHGPLAQSCVTACNHSTSAPQTLQLVAGGGESIKMHHQQHGHGQLQNTRQWRFDFLFTALLRQLTGNAPNPQKRGRGQGQVKSARAH